MRKSVVIFMTLLFVAGFGVGLLAPVVPAFACNCPGWCKAPCPPSQCYCSGSCHCCYCASTS